MSTSNPNPGPTRQHKDEICGGLRCPTCGMTRPRPKSMIAETVVAFITTAQAQGASLDVIDVADGQHGFDTLDHTDDCCRAVCQALS